MNILFISTIDNRGGGSKLPWNIMHGLKDKGHKVSMFVGYKYSDDPDVHKIPLNPFYYRLSKIFATDLRFARSGFLFDTPEYKEADIINCHNIHSGFFNWKDFERMAREKKVVWDVHDLWPITAGCTDIYRCRLDKPRRVLGFLWDNRPHLLNEKKKVYDKVKFDIITQSQWIKNKLTKGVIGNQPMHFINCSIDVDVFKNHDNKQSRQELGLPLDKKIILSIAGHGLHHKLKGSEYVKKIIDEFRDRKDVLFVALGGRDGRKALDNNANVLEAGYIDDEQILAKYYSTADFLLYPSLGDNLALAVLESMACGLPVVSFDTCGIPEAIGDMGYVARYEDLEDLKKGVDKLLSLTPEQRLSLGENCRSKIVENHALGKMIDDHEKLFLKISKNESIT